MSREKEDKFISLQEAVKFCEHSQEYLSLRARQGKLKAVKFGRNWVTKKEWLEEYLGRVEEYNNNNLKKKEVLPARRIPLKAGEGGPPSNLPVGNVELVPVRPIEYLISEFFRNAFKKATSSFGFRFGFALIMVSVLMVAAIGFWGRDSLRTVTDDVANVMLVVESKISEDEIYSAAVYDAADVFKNYFKWLGQNPVVKIVKKNVKFVWQNSKEGLENIAETISSIFSGAKEFVLNLFRPSEIPEPVKEGLVVIPSTERDAEIKEKIKESFSDEVKVELTDKTSGIITPVFRTGEGDRYLYILVPIKN